MIAIQEKEFNNNKIEKNMKKILILFLLLAPLFVNAQNWYKIKAMKIELNDGTETEWSNCDFRAFIAKNRDVKIFFPEGTQTYRAVDDDYQHKINDNGDVKIFWKALGDDGDRCVLYYMHDKYVSYIYIGIKFSDFKVWYYIIPDD